MNLSPKREIENLIKSAHWQGKAKSLKKKLRGISRIFSSKSHSSPDDFFFSFEDLPPMGKEYWFLHFSSPKSDSQVILTLGRSKEPVEVNKTALASIEGAGKAGVPCAAVCWLYRNKKRVLFDSLAVVRVERGKGGSRLEAMGGKASVLVSGIYPDFDISFREGKAEVFSARATLPRQGLPFEFVKLLDNPLAPGLSSAMVNYYFDFSGTLLGRPFSGRAYLQKVVAIMPLAPWNWVRVDFANGDCIDFFAGKPFGDAPAIHFADKAYFEHNGERMPINGKLSLSSWLEGEERVWLLEGQGIFLSMRSYSLQPFAMRSKTTFRYDEYLVRATDFSFSSGGRRFSLSSLGQGRGIVEEASGYLI